MILKILFAIFIFALGFTALYSAAICDKKWFKTCISVLFSVLVSMLVTSNMFM